MTARDQASFWQRSGDLLFARAWWALAIIVAVTVFFALQIPGMQLRSDFENLLPQEHPYIQLHNSVREDFGGADVLTVAVEVDDGTIFNNATLARIQRITEAVDTLPGVNHNLVSSLTYRTSRRIAVDAFGNVTQERYYEPAADALSDDELENLRRQVVADPRMYGRYVSSDLSVALIRAHFTTSESDVLVRVFEGMREIQERESAEGVTVHAVGSPMLTGWAFSYLSDILQIMLYTIALMVLLLIVYFRRLYGILLPLLGVALSTAWGLGFLNMVGLSLDPLTMPIPFLIAARATSHGVQIVDRFYYELARVQASAAAARNTLNALIRPGALAITTDAIGIIAIALGSAPFHQHLAAYAGFWAIAVIFTVNLFLPLMLLKLPEPRQRSNKRERATARVKRWVRPLLNDRRVTGGALTGCLLIFLGSGYGIAQVQFGDAAPGSPILEPDHEYNGSAALIASRFPGSEPLYVITSADDSLEGNLRSPEALRAMDAMERYVLESPVVGSSRSLPGLIKQVNRLIHDGDPRWLQIPDDVDTVAGVTFAYELSSPIPGALREYATSDLDRANTVFYLPDLRATTINSAIERVQEGIARFAGDVEGMRVDLAAGVVGVNAAINQSNARDSVVVTIFVLIAVFLAVAINYRSISAGFLVLASLAFATALSYGYIGLADVGVNVNIIPVIAVGMGVGIDYALYVMDRARAEVRAGMALDEAIAQALGTTGIAVLFTGAMLIAGVALWLFAELRFQKEAAEVLIVMLLMFIISALVLVPSWIMVFRPSVVAGGAQPQPTGNRMDFRPHPAETA